MPRIMSCAETVPAVLDETKTVTRRLGWWEDRNGRRLLKPGDELSLVAKAMGRRPGEPLVRLALVEVIDVRREPLDDIDDLEVHREGCVDHSEAWGNDNGHPSAPLYVKFIHWYADSFRCGPYTTVVTRIEWRYLHPIGRMSWGPTVVPVPCIEWDDGKRRPLRLVPDHLRHLHEGEIPEHIDPLPRDGATS